jgi:hypothetical protein
VIDHFKTKHYGMDPEAEEWKEEELPEFPADKSSRQEDLEGDYEEEWKKEKKGVSEEIEKEKRGQRTEDRLKKREERGKMRSER